MANWYAYNTIGDPLLPGSYSLMNQKPGCITSGVRVCAIYLNQSSDVPSTIDADVLDYIANAQGTQVSQPPASAKRFVYVKGQ